MFFLRGKKLSKQLQIQEETAPFYHRIISEEEVGTEFYVRRITGMSVGKYVRTWCLAPGVNCCCRERR